MFSQQINLYQPVFRKQQVQFSASSLLIVVLFMLFCLTGITAFSLWQGNQLTRINKQLSGSVSELESQIETLSSSLVKPRINKLLESELNTVQVNKQDAFKLLGLLRAQKAGSKEGFSDFFIGLARQVNQGVWLTSISISAGGQALALSGKTREPALVPELLQRLKAEPVFKGQTFQVMELKQQQETEEAMDQKTIMRLERDAHSFSLHTRVAGNGALADE